MQVRLFKKPISFRVSLWLHGARFSLANPRVLQRESSDDKSHINTNFTSNYCHNKKKHHPVARAHSVHNMRKAENHLLNFPAPEMLRRQQPPLCDNQLDTRAGFRTSLLPDRTVFQKGPLRTSNILAGSGCPSGGHQELLKATSPAGLCWRGPCYLGPTGSPEHLIRGRRTSNTDGGERLTGSSWPLEARRGKGRLRETVQDAIRSL